MRETATVEHRRALGRSVALACALVLTAACASFDPRPMEESELWERQQTQEREGLRVTVAVPSRREVRRAFGVDLEKRGIQPVWVAIENRTNVPYVLLMSGVDPGYFSAHEAAYKSHLRFRPFTNAKIDEHFGEYDIDPVAEPRGVAAGFVFTNLKLGTKEVRVKLQGPGRVHVFEFYVPVPGFRADYHEVDWEALLAQDFADHEDEDELRRALERLPCCTTTKLGLGRGDPLNLILVGTRDEVQQALIRSGWDETERLTWASAWRTFRAFFGGEYKYAPMSSLYLFRRGQDAGYQKARDTIHERNHLRLWLAPLRFRGEQVWVGTITRDIGVYFTRRAWNLTTHAIDPDVDEARRYLREDFAIAQSVERWGYTQGVGAATSDRPHRNLMNAPWWTDGMRLVMEVAKEPLPLEEQGFFYWDWPRENSEEINELLRALMER